MRWRIEAEVVTGKGQFICASKKCQERKKLRTWEVNFGYQEHGEKKNALVKCRLCFECSYKLNYCHKKKEVTRKKKKKKRSRSSSSSSESDSDKTIKKKTSSRKIDDKRPEKSQADLDHEASSMWSKPVEKEEERSRDEEFDDFLGDLFL